MRNLKLVLAYDGTGFHGFQTQAGRPERTVQGVVERRLAEIAGEPIKVVAAGRTDAGVHALGQVVSFRTRSELDPATWVRAVNAGLPQDVRVVSAESASDEFHARYSARGKTYRYLIQNGPVPAVLWRHYATFVPQRLEIHAMRDAAAGLVGRHDFASFQATGSAVRSTVREITQLSVTEAGLGNGDILGHGARTATDAQGPQDMAGQGAAANGRLIAITVTADGFLYNMVRIIAGLLIEVGLGKRAPAEVQSILEARDRCQAGITAPAHGLCLVDVFY